MNIAEGVPITIGVIGHCDLLPEEIPRIQTQFRMIIDSYRLNYPQSRLLLISALAAGADQIAVEACQGIANLDVLALLPMPSGEYENDFIDRHSLEKFRSLLNSASYQSDLQKLLPHYGLMSQPSTDSGYQIGEDRDRAYQQCARFVSLQSHVLIAIWDGQPSMLVGGTADTVFSRMRSNTTCASDLIQLELKPSESGIQIHIDANRLKSIDTNAESPNNEDLNPLPHFLLTPTKRIPWHESFPDPVSDQINSFNATLIYSNSQISPALSIKPLTLTGSVIQAADLIAIRYKNRFRRLSAALLVISLLTIFTIHLVQDSNDSWLFVSALLTFLAAGILWWVLTRVGYKETFEQYRALAEGARVQQVWLASEIDECVSDTYLIGQHNVRWVRRALRSAWLVDRLNQQAIQPTISTSTPNTSVPFDAKASEMWIKEQLEYLIGTSTRVGAADRSIRKVRQYRVIAGVGIFLALLGLIPELTRFTTAIQISPWLLSLSQGMWELGLGIFAISIAYAELMAFREIGRQHQMSIELFQTGMTALNLSSSATDSKERIKLVTVHVGTEALRHTSAWMALNHDRAIRPL